MKEKMVIEGNPRKLIERLLKASKIQLFENNESTEKVIIYGEELNIERIPETWNDFLELTKNKPGIQQSNDGNWIELTYYNNHTIDGLVSETILFHKNGIVSFNNGISIKRSIQQMYSLYLGFGNK